MWMNDWCRLSQWTAELAGHSLACFEIQRAFNLREQCDISKSASENIIFKILRKDIKAVSSLWAEWHRDIVLSFWRWLERHILKVRKRMNVTSLFKGHEKMQRKCAAEKWFYPSVRKLFINEVLVSKMIPFFSLWCYPKSIWRNFTIASMVGLIPCIYLLTQKIFLILGLAVFTRSVFCQPNWPVFFGVICVSH